jgi:hypothetical protein
MDRGITPTTRLISSSASTVLPGPAFTPPMSTMSAPSPTAASTAARTDCQAKPKRDPARGRNLPQHPRRRRFLIAAAAQLEHRQRMLRLHGIRITDDDHRLRGN